MAESSAMTPNIFEREGMKTITKLASAIALVGMMPFGHAAEIFTIQESAITGTPSNTVTANRLALRYEAFVDQQADGSFTENGIYDVTGILLGNTVQSSFLNSPEPNGYQLYGAFALTGNISFVPNLALATFDTGAFVLVADPLSNSDISNPGGTFTCAGTTCDDDILLAFSLSLIQPSSANIPLAGDQAASGGSYIINFDDLQYTTDGLAYFIDPSPFYVQLEITGENESFNPPLTAGAYQGVLQGDASVVFVPEPGTLGLLGLALLGLGFLGFRRTA